MRKFRHPVVVSDHLRKTKVSWHYLQGCVYNSPQDAKHHQDRGIPFFIVICHWHPGWGVNQIYIYIIYIYLDLPKGAEWMIRGAYTQSLRVQTAPFGRCWYIFGGWQKFLYNFGMIGPLPLRPCELLRAWGFQHIPSIACRIGFCILQSKSYFSKTATEMRGIIWLGPSLSLEEVLLSDPYLWGVLFWRKSFWRTWLDWGNLPRHHFSCACLAPEALSVRLGFLTKHYTVDLLMKYLFQKGFNDISI